MVASKSWNNITVSCALILSAAAALIYEIGATQILFFYFIESSYSLAIVLATFLTGLGLGSFITYRFLEKMKNKRMVFGVSQLVISGYAFLVLTNLSKIIPHISPLGIFMVSFLVLLVPTIFLGSIFPLSVSFTF